jgi:GNAT superfamily N-acetyltransferase
MDNLKRMIQLADEFFETKNDPSQLDITEEVMEQLRSIHPATMGETANEEGPIAWSIVIPTVRSMREKFIRGVIGEQELLISDRHLEGLRPRRGEGQVRLTSLYLCSALVLPEFRGKGLAKKLVLDSIHAIQKDHPIEELFVWAFSGEGNMLAERIASELNLPLFRKV